jgi:hypothetical protein
MVSVMGPVISIMNYNLSFQQVVAKTVSAEIYIVFIMVVAMPFFSSSITVIILICLDTSIATY